MGIGNWIIEKIEDCGTGICDTIEETGRKIERRGNALLGCDEYEDASFGDRMSCLTGSHDSGTFKDQIEKEKVGIKPGDIVGVSRSLYDHYGIFINKQQVISYTSKHSDIGDNTIQVTTFNRFLRDADEYFVLIFPNKHGTPDNVRFPTISASLLSMPSIDFSKFTKKMNYKLYSPEETIQRAKSRIGEDKYSLVFNNCEHFAIWCKTGIEESHQVNKLLKVINPIPLNKKGKWGQVYC